MYEIPEIVTCIFLFVSALLVGVIIDFKSSDTIMRSALAGYYASALIATVVGWGAVNWLWGVIVASLVLAVVLPTAEYLESYVRREALRSDEVDEVDESR